MKKITLSALFFSAILISCGDNGKQVEVNEAEEVEILQNESTVEFTTIEEGSYLDWRGAHLGGVQPRYGKIFLKSASALVNNNEISNATIEVDIKSLTVENFGEDTESAAQLAGHLVSSDLLNADDYPTAKFELTSVSEGTGEYNSTITGNLTILDTTKSIMFSANLVVSDNEISINSEDFAVNRQDWGIVYNSEGDEGVPAEYIIANDIGFTINVTLTK